MAKLTLSKALQIKVEGKNHLFQPGKTYEVSKEVADTVKGRYPGYIAKKTPPQPKTPGPDPDPEPEDVGRDSRPDSDPE